MSTIKVMVNGIPGNVATIVAKHILSDDRFELIPYSLTGPEIDIKIYQVGETSITLIHPEARETDIETVIAETDSPFISVDYTHPSAVNSNAVFYCSKSLPFVMGTTGGDRRLLMETISGSAVSAVVAPNMAKQIVGFQAMMAWAAETFPNLFHGYSLIIRESHQHGKADTSGTAKAMVGYFNRLGVDFSPDDIEKERDPEKQRSEWGIPEEFISGHGWHTYTLVSEDDTVTFQFSHNVNGREIYARGALDAIVFLDEKVRKAMAGKVFSMIDVLKGA